MKTILLTSLSAVCGVMAAPAANPDVPHANVTVQEWNLAEVTHQVCFGETYEYAGTNFIKATITAVSAGVQLQDVTCQPTWYFSGSGSIVGLAITSEEPGSPSQTFSNGNVTSFTLSCSQSARM